MESNLISLNEKLNTITKTSFKNLLGLKKNKYANHNYKYKTITPG